MEDLRDRHRGSINEDKNSPVGDGAHTGPSQALLCASQDAGSFPHLYDRDHIPWLTGCPGTKVPAGAQ